MRVMERITRILLVLAALTVVHALAHGQTAACAPNTAPLSNAEMTLDAGHPEQAEKMYQAALAANAQDEGAQAGLVRAELHQNKLLEAERDAGVLLTQHPNTSLAETTMAMVARRMGDLPGTYAHATKALALDPCNGQAHFVIGELLRLDERYVSAAQQMQLAQSLAPNDVVIQEEWKRGAAPPSPACIPVSVPPPGKLPLPQVYEEPTRGGAARAGLMPFNSVQTNGPQDKSYPVRGWGLDVVFGGKRERLIVSTATSGIILKQSTAERLGLKIVDDGKTTRAAHVDELHFGDFEFHDCTVRVVDDSRMQRALEGEIGLAMLGEDLVTLDFAGRELRYAMLPPVPGAAALHDRTVPPEMKDWTRTYRDGDLWLVPTKIDNDPARLFVFDIAEAETWVSTDAIRPLTGISDVDLVHYVDKNGNWSHPLKGDHVVLHFAGVQQDAIQILTRSFDNSSSRLRLEIDGVIGMQSIANTTLQLDYRDRLLKIARH